MTKGGEDDAAGVACDHVDGLPLRSRVLLCERERWFKSRNHIGLIDFLWPVEKTVDFLELPPLFTMAMAGGPRICGHTPQKTEK